MKHHPVRPSRNVLGVLLFIGTLATAVHAFQHAQTNPIYSTMVLGVYTGLAGLSSCGYFVAEHTLTE